MRVFATGLVLLVAGCATTVTPTAETSPAAAVLAPGMTRQLPGTVAVTLKRDSGFGGAGCTTRVYVGGTPIADLRVGQAIVVYMAPGDYVVGAKVTTLICGGGDAETAMRVLEGRPSAYRIGSGQDGTLRISPTAV